MSKLYVVGTPIGNLEDITLRALCVLKEADLILAEDTRVTKKLLNHFDIVTPVKRLDAHTEQKVSDTVGDLFKEEKTIVYVSDAGTPAISDPGARFVQAARKHGIEVLAVPGPSAVTAALSISGISGDHFVFLGFPPHKKGRKTFFEKIIGKKETVVFFESPHRILKALESLSENLGESRAVSVCRELTKIHEQVVSGSSVEVLMYFEENKDKIRGEFVVVISPELGKRG